MKASSHPFPIAVDATRTPEQQRRRVSFVCGFLIGSAVISTLWGVALLIVNALAIFP